MDVLLHIVHAAQPVPDLEDGIRGRTGSRVDKSVVCLTVGELRLTRSAAPSPVPLSGGAGRESPRATSSSEGANALQDWRVSLRTPGAALDQLPEGAESDAAPMQRSAESAVHERGSAPLTVRAAAVDLVDPNGRHHTRNGARLGVSIADLLSVKLRQLWQAARTDCGHSHAEQGMMPAPCGYAETVFVCGSRHSKRKDALYITLAHRLLTECALLAVEPVTGSASTAVSAEVALVDYDAVWGAGDVLAGDAAPGPITWLPLAKALGFKSMSTSPAADAAGLVSVQVRRSLQAWFDRIDGATARFPAPAREATATASVSAGERRRHLASNAVFLTLRLRCGTCDPHAAAAARGQHVSTWHLTLVLLPDSAASLCSAGDGAGAVEDAADVLAHRASAAALWRELEALAAYMQAEAARRSERRRHARHVAAVNVQEELRAAALRRSRWLSCLATLHHAQPHDSTARVAASREADSRTLAAFLAACSARSLTWVGCLDAAPAHGRATRSTLAFLARHQPTTERHRRQDSRAHLQAKGCRAARSPSPSPRRAGEAPQPYAPPVHRLGHASLDTTADAERSSTVRSIVADHAATCEPVPAVEAAPPSSDTAAAALVVSLQGYVAVLEDEVRRLCERLDRYEPTASPMHSTHAVASTVCASTPAAPSQRVAAPARPVAATPAQLAGAMAALDDVRNDPRLPTALLTKLDGLAARLADVTPDTAPMTVAVPTPLGATQASHGRDTYVALLEARVALYEQKLALMDHYVAPVLVRCVDDLDHLHTQQHQHRGRRPEVQRLAVAAGGAAGASANASRAFADVK